MKFARAGAIAAFVAGVSVVAAGQQPLPPVPADAVTASVDDISNDASKWYGKTVRVADIPAFVSAGADAVHLSARRASGDTAPSGPGGGVSGFDRTDPEIVAAARAALDGIAFPHA